jgi:dipeptidyl aminopeptidase/acylaminoacyl peptidase
MPPRLFFRTLLPLLATTLLSAALYAQTHPLSLDDLAKMQQVGRPVPSPDGTWIAYTLRHTDIDADKHIATLWMARWDGSEDLQLTYDNEGASDPRWSPDGRYLAFLSDRPGPGKAKGTQVWVLDRRGGEAHQFTQVKEDIDDYRWSPDSKQLLLTLMPKDEPDPDEKKNGKPAPPKPIVIDRYQFKQDVEGYLTDKHDHLYLFNIATSKLTRLIPNEEDRFEEHDAEFSPNGKQIAFTSRRELPDPFRTANSDVYVVDATPGSTPHQLTTFKGPDDAPLAWSPDSSLIAYRQATVPGYSIYNQYRLAVVPAAGGAPRLLGLSLDRPVSAPIFTPDGKSLLTTVSDDRNGYVENVPIDGAKPTRLTEGMGDAAALASAAGHSSLLFSTDNRISEIYALQPDNTLRQVTHHNDALLATLALAPTQDLAAKTKDGNEVHALLTMPIGYKSGSKSPMILFIHGGPTAQDVHTFDLSRQMFAAHGYAVLQVNYRGSDGRGFEYSHTINADWGNKEVIDLLAAVDAAVATGTIDPAKLVIGGWSYGGILTDYSIATTTRFKAASSGAGMGNLLGLYGVDEYILQYDNELGQPWKHPELYIKLSYPFFHADRITTPTLFMGGDRDFNVPLEGGEQMYEALRSNNVPAELIVYPGQFHGFTRPSFIRDRYQRWFNWYDKYLGITPPKPAATAVTDAAAAKPAAISPAKPQ